MRHWTLLLLLGSMAACGDGDQPPSESTQSRREPLAAEPPTRAESRRASRRGRDDEILDCLRSIQAELEAIRTAIERSPMSSTDGADSSPGGVAPDTEFVDARRHVSRSLTIERVVRIRARLEAERALIDQDSHASDSKQARRREIERQLAQLNSIRTLDELIRWHGQTLTDWE